MAVRAGGGGGSSGETAVLLLAGGTGSRLNVLARERAKPALPFGGSYRIIDFALSNVMASGLDNVGVLTQYQPLSLMGHLGDGSSWDLSGAERGLHILPPATGTKSSDWFRGTADAVWRNMAFVDGLGADRVLILSGDHIYRMDYRALIEFHEARGAAATLAVIEVPLEEARRFGVLRTDAGGKVVEFEEKPPQPRWRLASTGIYVFERAVLERHLRDVVGAGRGTDFGKDILSRLVVEGSFYAYPFQGYWRDVGTIASYWEASMDLLRPRESGLDLESWGIYTNPDDRHVAERPAVRLGPRGCIRGSLVSRGAVILGSVSGSIISPGVVVEEGATVVDSVVFHDVRVGARSRVTRTIVDKDVAIGADCVIGSAEPGPPNRRHPEHLSSGFVVIGKPARVPAGTEIGTNVIVEPGAVESDFPSSRVVLAGETVAAIAPRATA